MWLWDMCRASGALWYTHITHGDAVGYRVGAPPALAFFLVSSRFGDPD